MFERRLKIFLLALLLFTVGLMVRAAQVQVVQHTYWTQLSESLLQRTQTAETTRGQILDIHGKPLAVDIPCTDACVDYRAIIDPPDPKWLADIVGSRLQSQLGPAALRHAPTVQLAQWRKDETAVTLADINQMWAALAELYQPESAAVPAATQPSDDDVDVAPPPIDRRAAIAEIRRGIITDMQTQRRLIWYLTFQRNQTRAADLPRWQRWLSGRATGDDAADMPDVEELAGPVSGETEPHVILHKLDPAAVNFLGKRLEKYPGLSLRPSTRRFYPQHEVAAHVLGRMGEVAAADVERSQDWDTGRRYRRTDDIGREGIEAMCEPLLRGERGTTRQRVGDDAVLDRKPFAPGQDVHLSIDADLQADLQQMLKTVRVWDSFHDKWATGPISMHGAAVVLDVPTGEVRAMASNPTFDPNTLDAQQYAALMGDTLNAPLRNRATSDAFEPGSTVKPMVGFGAITDGMIGPVEGIECTGYLVLPVYDAAGRTTGRKIKEHTGRCWVASEYTLAELAERSNGLITSYAHHPIPVAYPHRGHDNNPDGWLSYRDALERSCNIFFETVADRMGPVEMAKWYDAFGFGRKTGIGIAEVAGLRPGQRPVLPVTRRMSNCLTGIGEGQVWATPLQIANEAATVARNGIWKRPRLLTIESQTALYKIAPPPKELGPDTVDLHLSPQALEQAREGMVNVVNSPAGTGAFPRRTDMIVAGKTGSAQGARLFQTETDDTGRSLRGPDGRLKRTLLVPATLDHPDTPTPWYRMQRADEPNVVHSWFMGFAPADDPQIAFCVLIEYSGSSGDSVAGPVAKQLLEACVQRGYLHPGRSPVPLASAE